ncbi:type II toxin-antitoxin system HicB family antitoxin [Secundilactobacillus mixtipabuli]|uniref:Uncharacterized protein n=1 Tax=Secundilactobacillus mixtipabuli TaxID=1435342 RepID=A0A1Z5I8Y8_9LACO|nr:type II toxin-antitoxin system HicB family antitoxin [Secundilactobacillus mixtipabuli]GAW98222.1 hypothetical protein IWT30_00165 [Secundilactobacillus mixtipabuli]
MAQRLVYPAIFDPTVMINRVQVTVPDVPGVKVMGTANDDAAQKAAEAVGTKLAKSDDELPVPSTPGELKTKPGQTVSFIVLDLDEYKK